MTTKDLQRIDILVRAADMAVRVSSQLRLWLKRRSFRDHEAIDEAVQFLGEAVVGGRFVDSGKMVASFSSLYPLTWSADVHFGPSRRLLSPPVNSPSYEKLVEFLDTMKDTLLSLKAGSHTDDNSIHSTELFFEELGQFLGGKADCALRSPAIGTQLLHDRFSYQ